MLTFRRKAWEPFHKNVLSLGFCYDILLLTLNTFSKGINSVKIFARSRVTFAEIYDPVPTEVKIS